MKLIVTKEVEAVEGQGAIPETLKAMIALTFNKCGTIHIAQGIVGYSNDIRLSDDYYNLILDAVEFLRSFEKGYICPNCNGLKRDPQEIYFSIFHFCGVCKDCRDKDNF